MMSSNLTLACIGGSFAHELLADRKLSGTRLGTRKTPFGVSQPIYQCEQTSGRMFLLLRHGDGHIPLASSFANHRANIFALKELGVTHIVSWSGARAVSHNYHVGQFVLPDDLIDDTRHRAGTFFEHGAPFDLRQWPAFCSTLRSALVATFRQRELKVSETGTYLCGEGPRRETRAEVRKYALWGADVLGHSLVPEAFLAKELQMCYASLCLICDFAETGSVHRPYEAGSLFNHSVLTDFTQRVREMIHHIPAMIETLFTVLPEIKCQCTCQTQLDELIESGLLARDFHHWFETRPARRTATGEEKKISPLNLNLPPAAGFTDQGAKSVTAH